MKKALILLSFVSSSLFSMELAVINHTDNKHMDSFLDRSTELDRVSYADNKNKMYIAPFLVKSPGHLGSPDLYHSTKGFYVRHDEEKHSINRYNMDPMLRGITKTQLKAFLENGYLSLNKTEDGQYLLKAKQRLIGGGPIGATIGVFLGKAAVSIVGHGAIQIVALCTGPAYFPVMVALESTLGVAIEKASIAGAVAGGIALGAATGPL